MTAAAFPFPNQWTLADLLAHLGGISAERVRLCPPPGTATEADLLKAGKPTCELIDGVLVEKGMGFTESVIGACVLSRLDNHARPRNLGLVCAADGTLRLWKGRVQAGLQ